MPTLNWQDNLRQRFRDEPDRAVSYLEAILEDAAADGYTGAIVATVEDVAAALGRERACAIVEDLAVGRSEHRKMMFDAVKVSV